MDVSSEFGPLLMRLLWQPVQRKKMPLCIKSDVTLPQSVSLLTAFTVTVYSSWVSEHFDLRRDLY